MTDRLTTYVVKDASVPCVTVGMGAKGNAIPGVVARQPPRQIGPHYLFQDISSPGGIVICVPLPQQAKLKRTGVEPTQMSVICHIDHMSQQPHYILSWLTRLLQKEMDKCLQSFHVIEGRKDHGMHGC